jgi:hypothetical protein
MSTDRESPNGDGGNFEEKLRRLRLKIDMLPEAQRPHLIELADVIAGQHRRLERVIHHHDAD